MIRWDTVMDVQKMQDYIKEHSSDDCFNFDKLYATVGYSKRNAERIFKRLTGKTVREYLLSITLSESSKKLLKAEDTILDIALETAFKSHEGYTRAFNKKFGLTPSEYIKGKPPIPLFVQYPIKASYSYLDPNGGRKMENSTSLVMVTLVQRPQRKLMFLRSKKAHDYWTYCEEVGCDWEGLFNSVDDKFDTAALLELPSFLQKEGYSAIASGIEIPFDYHRKCPENCEIVDLDACELLYFQSEPFNSEEDYGIAIGHVFQAISKYNPNQYGFEFAFELAPKFNFGAQAAKGAKQALPIKRI